MGKLRGTIDLAATVLVTAAALVMAGVYLIDRAGAQAARPELPTRFVETWEADNALGVRIGPRDASIVITEFMDFQCPFCRQLVAGVDSLLTEFPNEIAVVFQHFPLRNHSFAIPAAIAAECAERQRLFVPMYRTLFANQEMLGATPWRELAGDAGLLDLDAFDRCIVLPVDSFPRIQDGLATGARTGVTATPTVWVNGRVGRLNRAAVRALAKEAGSKPNRGAVGHDGAAK